MYTMFSHMFCRGTWMLTGRERERERTCWETTQYEDGGRKAKDAETEREEDKEE